MVTIRLSRHGRERSPTCSLRFRRCRMSCANTCGTQKISSGYRPSCIRSTRSPLRTSSSAPAHGRSLRRHRFSHAFTDGVGSTDAAGSGEFATELNTERFVPYYTLMRNPSTGENEFVILRPYVPFSTDDGRTELQAYITASSDPDSYGRLTTYLVDQEPLPAGPYRVATQAESEQLISREITLQATKSRHRRSVRRHADCPCR